MTALLTGETVDPVPPRPRSNGAIGVRFDPMTHPASQWSSSTPAASGNLSAPGGALWSSNDGSRAMVAQRDSRKSNALSLASLCSGTAGTCTGKLKPTTETPSLTSARFAGTGTRAAKRPRDRSISLERERQFGGIRKREKPIGWVRKHPPYPGYKPYNEGKIPDTNSGRVIDCTANPYPRRSAQPQRGFDTRASPSRAPCRSRPSSR